MLTPEHPQSRVHPKHVTGPRYALLLTAGWTSQMTNDLSVFPEERLRFHSTISKSVQVKIYSLIKVVCLALEAVLTSSSGVIYPCSLAALVPCFPEIQQLLFLSG